MIISVFCKIFFRLKTVWLWQAILLRQRPETLVPSATIGRTNSGSILWGIFEKSNRSFQMLNVYRPPTLCQESIHVKLTPIGFKGNCQCRDEVSLERIFCLCLISRKEIKPFRS